MAKVTIYSLDYNIYVWHNNYNCFSKLLLSNLHFQIIRKHCSIDKLLLNNKK